MLLLNVVLAPVVLGQASSQQSGLVGVVTSSGKPLAGVAVQVALAGNQEFVATATTGADGKYRLVPLARGVYRVEFHREGFDPIIRWGIVVLENLLAELNAEMVRSASPASAPSSSSEGQSALRPGEVAVRIETSLGAITVAVDTTHAPLTSANFLKYVDGGFYDGGRFHRATRPDNYQATPPNRPMMELIQGGINPDLRNKAFKPIPLERTSVTGLKHVRGTVSMARGNEADTATSDFFILLDDQPSLDFGGKRFDDGQGAAAFGRVISGMDVVRKIQQQPVQGQNLNPAIPMITVKRR